MSKLEVPAVDAVRAKIMARAVQRRYQELGTTVSLNHAYEAVAAVFEFSTWSRMKARLEEAAAAPVTDASVKGNIDKLTADLSSSRLQWSDMALADLNPVIMVTGPDGFATRETLIKLLRTSLDRQGPQPVRLISRNAHFGFVSTMHGKTKEKSVHTPDSHAINVASIGQSKNKIINIFDTENGQREPTAPHRARLIDFLSAILHFGEKKEIPGSLNLIGAAIDAVYESTNDMRRNGVPHLYHEGLDVEVDAVYRQLRPKRTTVETWWDVADELVAKGYAHLHQRACAFAAPRLDHFMKVLRDPQIMNIHGTALSYNGEKLVDLLARRIASTIKEHVFLQGPSTVAIDFNAPFLAVEIVVKTDDEFQEALLQRIALDACMKGCFAEKTIRPDAGKGIVVIESVDLLSQHGVSDVLQNLFEGAHGNGPSIIASTSTSGSLATFVDWITANVVIGCKTRLEVAGIASVVGFNETSFEQMHTYLFDAGLQYSAPAAVCSRRGFRSLTEGLVQLPPG
jgi:hypothetical protein